MNAAISPVHATMPTAMSVALPAIDSRGFSEFVAATVFFVGWKPPATTAASSRTAAPTRIQAIRLIGPRGSLRSVRYQWPSNSPSRTAPVKMAPARSWKNESGTD